MHRNVLVFRCSRVGTCILGFNEAPRNCAPIHRFGLNGFLTHTQRPSCEQLRPRGGNELETYRPIEVRVHLNRAGAATCLAPYRAQESRKSLDRGLRRGKIGTVSVPSLHPVVSPSCHPPRVAVCSVWSILPLFAHRMQGISV